MSVVRDGKGRGHEVAVNVNNEALVSGPVDGAPFYINRTKQQAYAMQFSQAVDAVGPGTGEFLYIKNLDDEDLVITSISALVAVGTDVMTVMLDRLGDPTAGIASLVDPGPVNLFAGSNNEANATIWQEQDISSLTGGRAVDWLDLSTAYASLAPLSGYVLKKNATLTLDLTTGGSTATVIVHFHFGSVKE